MQSEQPADRSSARHAPASGHQRAEAQPDAAASGGQSSRGARRSAAERVAGDFLQVQRRSLVHAQWSLCVPHVGPFSSDTTWLARLGKASCGKKHLKDGCDMPKWLTVKIHAQLIWNDRQLDPRKKTLPRLAGLRD